MDTRNEEVLSVQSISFSINDLWQIVTWKCYECVFGWWCVLYIAINNLTQFLMLIVLTWTCSYQEGKNRSLRGRNLSHFVTKYLIVITLSHSASMADVYVTSMQQDSVDEKCISSRNWKTLVCNNVKLTVHSFFFF